ncbi:MAG: LysR family transcriptional regulator [Coriobacteriia bacterium]
MELAHLREFAVVGTVLNFTTAAKRLNIAQPTLSKHISELEREVGAALLVRDTVHTALTPAGRFFLQGATGLLEEYDHLIQATRDLSRRHVDVVRVGGDLRAVRPRELVEAATSLLLRQQAVIDVELYGPHTSACWTEIAANSPQSVAQQSLVDVTILEASEHYVSGWVDFEKRFLCRIGLVVFVAADDPLSSRDEIALHELADHTLVFSTAFAHIKQVYIEICHAAEFHPKSITCVAANFADLMTLHHSGEAYLVDIHTATRVSAAPISGLVQVKINDPNAYIDVWALWQACPANPGVAAFVDALEDASRILGKGPELPRDFGLSNSEASTE